MPRAAAIIPVRSIRNAMLNRLRLLREQAGLSQKALGGQIGVPGQLLGEWERGEVTPNVASFIKWVRALDMDVCLRAPYGSKRGSIHNLHSL